MVVHGVVNSEMKGATSATARRRFGFVDGDVAGFRNIGGSSTMISISRLPVPAATGGAAHITHIRVVRVKYLDPRNY